jgi:hypothetical protein
MGGPETGAPNYFDRCVMALHAARLDVVDADPPSPIGRTARVRCDRTEIAFMWGDGRWSWLGDHGMDALFAGSRRFGSREEVVAGVRAVIDQ